MEPMVTTKRVLIRLHMYPTDNNDEKMSNKYKKIFSCITIVLLFIVALTGLIGTLTFYFVHLSIDLQQSLLAIIPAASMFNMAYNIVAAFSLRYKTQRIFTQLSAIYGASMCILMSAYVFLSIVFTC